MSEKEQMAYEPKSPKKKSNFLKFIYNSDSGQVLGRTGKSWLHIGLFYLVFYACLAAFFAIMLLVFLQTLKTDEPTWQLEESRIGNNPGMGYIPKPDIEKDIDSTLIRFSQGTPETNWNRWAKGVQEFIEENKKNRKNSDGGAGICDPKDTQQDGKSCHVDVDRFDLNSTECTSDQGYGFKYGTPCIIVKLNRIFNWKPKPFDPQDLPSDMPQSMKDAYDVNFIGISCEGENSADKENIGPLEYIPKNGLQNNFFPFRRKGKYETPFVFVRFVKPTKGVLINVECRAWAKNIKYDRAERTGSVHFELLID